MSSGSPGSAHLDGCKKLKRERVAWGFSKYRNDYLPNHRSTDSSGSYVFVYKITGQGEALKSVFQPHATKDTFPSQNCICGSTTPSSCCRAVFSTVCSKDDGTVVVDGVARALIPVASVKAEGMSTK